MAGRVAGMGRSSVYAALAALQRDGFVEARWDHTQSHPRRMVKISPSGRAALAEERRILAPDSAPGTAAYLEEPA